MSTAILGKTAPQLLAAQAAGAEESHAAGTADLSSLTSMLQARWKGGASSRAPQPEAVREGQVRSFRITKVDREAKKIELELA